MLFVQRFDLRLVLTLRVVGTGSVLALELFDLRSVLAEEELHLDGMLARLNDMDERCAPRVSRFQALERERFRVLWDAIEAECSNERLAAE